MTEFRAADVRLVIAMAQYLWAGDPELVQDKHWDAFSRLCDQLGMDFK